MAPKLSGPISIRQENPKKAGSKVHVRYELYKVAKTVEEALRLGASMADIVYDHKLGYVTLLGERPLGEAAAEPHGEKRSLGAESAKRAVEPLKEPESAAAEVAEMAVLPSPHKRRAVVPEGAPEDRPAASSSETPAESDAKSAAPIVESGVAALQVSACAPAEDVAAAPAVLAVIAKPPGYDVDLSFVKHEGKPLKFIKRSMGEAKKILCPRGLEDGRKEGFEFRLLDRDNLAKWAVTVRDLNADGQLAKDLIAKGLDTSIDLEISLPNGFPLEPPFVRVVYPQLEGGFVFRHGGICFEPLTPKGWAPSMTLPSLVIAIKGILDMGGVRCTGSGELETRTVKGYTEEAARKDHTHIVSAHQGGDSRTYGSLKSYKS